MLPVRRNSFLVYRACEGWSCSCDHLRSEEEVDVVAGEVLDALLLAGREECERERWADDEDEGRDGGRSDAGANERLRTESR